MALTGALLAVAPPAVHANDTTTTGSTSTDTSTGDTTTGDTTTGTSAGTKGKAGPYAPRQGAHFNTPRHGDAQYVLHDQIMGAIRHAKKGSLIQMAIFSFDRTTIAKALINAHKRGVQVQILLNDHQVTKAQRMLHKALGRNRHRKSFTYECTHGCRSGGEILHTKFYLFTHTGAARDVVMTGSVNLTGNSAKNQYNDLWIRNDTTPLYNAFDRLFQSMRKDKPARPGYWVQNIGKTFQLQAMPDHPKRPSADPIMRILNNVTCKGAARGYGTAGHRTIVRVIMHTWNEDRGVYLAKKIRRLYAAGCDVKVIWGFAGAKVRQTLAKKTARGPVPGRASGFDTNGDGFLDLYTHQKELFISGNYHGDKKTKLVVTGSSNWNHNGLIGDEEIFVMKLPGAFASYNADFDRMWTKYTRGTGYGQTLALPTEGRLLAPRATTVTVGGKRGGPAWEND